MWHVPCPPIASLLNTCKSNENKDLPFLLIVKTLSKYMSQKGNVFTKVFIKRAKDNLLENHGI